MARKRRLRVHGQASCCPARARGLADPADRRLRQRLHAARRRRAGDADRHGHRPVGQEGDRRAALGRLGPERRDAADADALPPRPRRRCGVRRQGDRSAGGRARRRRGVRPLRHAAATRPEHQVRQAVQPVPGPEADSRDRGRGARRRPGGALRRRHPGDPHAGPLAGARVLPARGVGHADHRRRDLQRARPSLADEVPVHATSR